MILVSANAEQILKKRYYNEGEHSWEDLAPRVGMGVCSGSLGERFTAAIGNREFIPAGRILRNVGRPRGSLFNCYHLPIGDSREEIGELFKNSLILWGEGGGIGINFSTLRPKGFPIKGVGGQSSGLVSFMRAVDGIAATVESGGQRRAASLGLCEVWHPEVFDFLDAKRQDGDISYFNISIGVNEEFIQSVREQGEWDLHFNSIPVRRVESQYLWQRIVSGMVYNGEPGLLNMTNLRANNSYYFAPINGTNPCGEACLEDYGVCNLGSIVLPKFVSNGKTQWSKMEEVIRLGIRFLDSCIDINRFNLEPVKRAALRGRRVGLGVMGLADLYFGLGLRYGSREAIDYTEKLFKFIRNVSYEESIKLSMEKGSFPAFESNAYCKAKFVRSLPFSLRKEIRTHGIRNVTLMAMAPTGTISLIPECTPSIEPLMYKAYRRTDRVSERVYLHPLAEKNIDAEWYVDSTNLSPSDHLETQATIQKYCDGAVSKTILVPKDFSPEELSEILLESIDDLKGVTVYRDGSRENQIINPISVREALNEQHDNVADAETATCASGTCEL